MKIGSTPPQSPPRITGLPDQGPTRADAFDALGMFGLSRSRGAPEPTKPGVAPAPGGGAAGADERDPRPGATKATQLPEPLRCATPAPQKPGSFTPLGPPTVQQETNSGFGLGDAVGAPVAGALEGEAGSGDEAPGQAGLARPRPVARPQAASLALREENGAAEVVAAIPGTDPDARQSLRRLVGEILARNGLALIHFHLNGAPVAPDFLGKTGGSHGSRAR